jgi:hypothetical protein
MIYIMLKHVHGILFVVKDVLNIIRWIVPEHIGNEMLNGKNRKTDVAPLLNRLINTM